MGAVAARMVSSSIRLRTVLNARISSGVTWIRAAREATASSWRRSARIAVARAVNPGSTGAGRVSIVAPIVFAAAITAWAMSGTSAAGSATAPPRAGVARTDSPRRTRSMVPAGHCSTSSNLARVACRGQLRPFSKEISAPALITPSAARLRWLMLSSRRRAAAAAPARTMPASASTTRGTS